MKISKPEIIAASVALSAALLAGVGAVVHSTSVKNQICLSYESQLEAQIDDATKTTNRLLTVKKIVDENPFAVLGFIGEINDLTSKALNFERDSNDLRYAYDATCGAERVQKFKDRPDIQAKVLNLVTWSEFLRD